MHTYDTSMSERRLELVGGTTRRDSMESLPGTKNLFWSQKPPPPSRFGSVDCRVPVVFGACSVLLKIVRQKNKTTLIKVLSGVFKCCFLCLCERPHTGARTTRNITNQPCVLQGILCSFAHAFPFSASSLAVALAEADTRRHTGRSRVGWTTTTTSIIADGGDEGG
jgi:hypothetical protein